ncbi:glyoxalase [Rhodococcus sp. HNM0569]|uniref:glyoxalase n=1 Tax=Rhodococcus sp. HNM0569 TaxID=2716340 RepID=UPI00146D1525|nr:glyoxalase [Rhodococcus sp. HNM0569]NLU82149.1 glyoxalase [Rhodococcus sp. HNM0569]
MGATNVSSVILDAADPDTATQFYRELGVGPRIGVRAGNEPSSGFRGYTLSLVVSQPNIVDLYVDAATAGGAAVLKAPQKSLWGYGGAFAAPDGAIWTIASSSKKNSGPATRTFDELVLLLGVADVKASKQFYVEHGLEVEKSFGRKYVQFAGSPDGITLALNGRRALAKNAGVSAEGSGAHRITIESGAGEFTDPDGFAWGTP